MFIILEYLLIKDFRNQLIGPIRSDQKVDYSFPLAIYNTYEFNTHLIFVSHLLFDCLLRMHSNDRNKFISLRRCECKDDESELNIICGFENNYTIDHY